MSPIVHLHNINDKKQTRILPPMYLILSQLDSVEGCDKIKDAKWTKKSKIGFSYEYKFHGRPYC